MNISLLIPPVFAFIVTITGIFLMLKFFPSLKLMDRPHEYGLSRAPIPYSGGIIFYIVFVVSCLLFVTLTKQIAGTIFAATLIVFVSFMDDRIRLSPWFRLAAQILAGIIVVIAGTKIQLLNSPFGGPILLDKFSLDFLGEKIWLISGVIIVVWLVLMMNVMNWLDGIPGLSSGISTIAQISIFLLAVSKFNVVDQSAVIAISSVLAASTLAFLIFDFSPPRILMGDTGSMFLGFMLGMLSILGGGKLATALLIMGFPVLDAIFVIFMRILRGTSPFHGDLSHFHHRLLRVGLSPRASLFFNYLFCILFAVIALTLNSTFSKFLAFLGALILMIIIGLIILMYNTHEAKRSAPKK